MSKRTTPKPKPETTTYEALAKIKTDLTCTRFVWHTLVRIITQRVGCQYTDAEKIAQAMLTSGQIVAADPVGLTKTATFKLNDQ